jgi:hypothetical protein
MRRIARAGRFPICMAACNWFQKSGALWTALQSILPYMFTTRPRVRRPTNLAELRRYERFVDAIESCIFRWSQSYPSKRVVPLDKAAARSVATQLLGAVKNGVKGRPVENEIWLAHVNLYEALETLSSAVSRLSSVPRHRVFAPTDVELLLIEPPPL